MIYVISDLHGFPHEQFLSLLNKAGFSENDFLYILGDVIDRNGDGGVKTLQWLLYQTNVELLLGNHEAMLLSCSFLFDEIEEGFEDKLTTKKLETFYQYMANGGNVTLSAMKKLSRDEQQDILEYIQDCPLYESVEIGKKKFVLVHAGLNNYSDTKSIEDYSIEELIWGRPKLSDVYSKNFLTVLGHAPTLYYGRCYEDKIIWTETWINIDIGSAYGKSPVLLRLNDMAEFRL